MREYGLWPRKGLGQNFLVDEGALSRIVEAAELSPEDTVVEVGAGPGFLTRLLAQRAGHVIAVELDEKMVNLLRRELAAFPNLEVIHGDILDLPPSVLMMASERLFGAPRPYKVVANIPYYITSAVLRHFLEDPLKPGLMVVTVQWEVAQRLVAAPGEMSLLAVSVQFYGRPRILFRIPSRAFYPAPKVDSAAVRIDVYPRPAVEVKDVGRFFEVVRAGFAHRRKQLRNALARGLSLEVEKAEEALQRAGIDPRRRAETLSLEEWARLCEELGYGPRTP